MADPNITSQGAVAVVVFDLLVVIVEKKKKRVIQQSHGRGGKIFI
jgi:hypothetical protein